VSLAKSFQKMYPSIDFYAVSCVAHNDLCQQYNVDAYPSIFTINAAADAGDSEQQPPPAVVLLKPGKLTMETLEEAFGLTMAPNDGALPLVPAAASRNSIAAARRESRHRRDVEEAEEEEEDKNDDHQRKPPRDDNANDEEVVEEQDKEDEDEEEVEYEDEESLGGGGGFQDSATVMLRKIGAAAKKEFLDPFTTNSQQQEDEDVEAEDELEIRDDEEEEEDDTDDADADNTHNNNNHAASKEENTKRSFNRNADYEEEKDDQRARQKATKRSDKNTDKNGDGGDNNDDEEVFEKIANVAGLTVRENGRENKPGAALARQRGRGAILPLRTKEGLRTSVLKRKGETSGGGFLLNRGRNNRKFLPAKPGLRPQDKPAPAGETDTMKAHRKGTQEFEDRKALILAEIERVKGRQVRDEVEKKWTEIMLAQGAKGRAPYKKVVAKPRLVERLPVVKRFVPKAMGEEEALMLDTSLSFLHGLKMGLFRESGPLSLRKKQALTDWLDLMSIALPQEWGLQTAIDDLSDSIDLISQDQKSLERILFRHKLHRVTWSDSCSSSPKKKDIGISGGGFTCGFWKLIHTMTIGIAEHRGGQVRGPSAWAVPMILCSDCVLALSSHSSCLLACLLACFLHSHIYLTRRC
jgi:hypothetical protein